MKQQCIFPLESLEKGERILILNKNLEDLKNTTQEREKWLNDASNYGKINYEHVARCVREDNEEIKLITKEMNELKNA